MTKRKITLRLASDEVAVVWPLEYWRHLIMVYRFQATEAQTKVDEKYWLDAASYIESCIDRSEATQAYE